jgi:hypothetical protein
MLPSPVAAYLLKIQGAAIETGKTFSEVQTLDTKETLRCLLVSLWQKDAVLNVGPEN